VAKQQKTERQAKIDAIRKQQKSAEKRRGLMIVGVCAVVALLIVGAAAYGPIKNWWDVRQLRDLDLGTIGAPASVCQEVQEKSATGSGDHVEPGTDIPYEDAPPAFGTHYDVWADIERKFYTDGDRPDVGELVHNLEHGYTLLWYDDTIADDGQAMDDLRAIASKFTDDDNLRNKFKIVPWTSDDGDAFPDGQHLAFTHWSIGGDGEVAGDQFGITQYCSEPSGAAVEEFMKEYPYTDSPEAGVPDMQS
jgi:hypothetical protein